MEETALKTIPHETDVTVMTVATLLAGFNEDREAVHVQNQGTTDIVISWRPIVTTSTGFRLPPGATFSATFEEDGDLVKQQLYGITDVVQASVHVLETIPGSD